MKWLSGIASLIGLWILISPFAFEATAAALWNNVLVRAAIFRVAGSALVATENQCTSDRTTGARFGVSAVRNERSE